MEFTKDTIAALELPTGKTDLIVFDDDLPGFGIRLRAGGKRVWIAQYRANGAQRRETLGDVRKVDLRAARAAAQGRLRLRAPSCQDAQLLDCVWQDGARPLKRLGCHRG